MDAVTHEVVAITPTLAKKLLDHNYDKNRKMSRDRIRFLSREMKRGAWTFNPSPITIDKEGRVIDGQHRLAAVIDSGMTIDMCVLTGVEDGIFKNIDTGMLRRPSDSLGISQKIVEIVKAMLIYTTGYHRFISNSQIEAVYALFAPELLDFHKTFTVSHKGLTNGPIRLAAIISVLNGADKDFVYNTYNSFVHLKFSELSNAASLFLKRTIEVTSDKNYRIIRQGAGHIWHQQTFTMALDMFDETKSDITRLVLTENKIEEAAALVRRIVLERAAKEHVDIGIDQAK